MPLNLDSCIAGVFTPGNIGASSGLPPVAPGVPSLSGPAPALIELATASDTLDFFMGELLHEVAHAVDTIISSGGTVDVAVLEATNAADTVTVSGILGVAVTEIVAAADTSTSTITSVLSISGTPVTIGTEYEHGVGSSYAGFTVTASGGTPPYTYSVASGTLPSGITLNSSSGAVSGTPAFESAGTYSGIVIRVTDNVAATANLASFTLTIAYKDPYFSSTKLLIDHDAADGSTTFTDASSAARGSGTALGNVQHDTGVTPPYGSSWYLFDGTGDMIRFADSNDWNLGTQNFTLDVVVRPSNVSSGSRFWIAQWASAPNLNFAFYGFTGGEIWFNASTTGSNTFSDVSALAAMAINTTYHVRLDFNGTKYRLYKNGVMVGSSTTLRSLYTGSTEFLAIGANSTNSGFYYAGHMKGIRITVGVARTASDSGYTISNRALPTS